MKINMEEQGTTSQLPKIQIIDVGPAHHGLIDLVKSAPGAGSSFPTTEQEKESGLAPLAKGLFKRAGL